MATYSRKLKDSSGNYICPVTRAEMVYFSDNTVLSKLTFYPVGSVYQSFEDTSPASLFGGEWEKLENTFLYGSGDKTLGTTGGEETHKLIESEIPDLKISSIGVQTFNGNVGGAENTVLGASVGPSYVITPITTNTGGETGISHNNMPPYTVINIWKRTA